MSIEHENCPHRRRPGGRCRRPLLIVLSAVVRATVSSDSSTAACMPGKVPTVVVNEQGDRGGHRRPHLQEGRRDPVQGRAPVSDEVHLHGYDVMQGGPEGVGTVTFDVPAELAGVFEVELEGRGEQIGGAHRSTRRDRLELPAGRRPRAGGPPGPAASGLALRLGVIDRPDRLLRRAGRLAQAALRELRVAPPRNVYRGAHGDAGSGRRGAIGALLLAFVVWTGCGADAPDRNFSVTFVFVTAWLGFVLLSVLFGDVFRAFNPWRRSGVPRARFGELVGRSSPLPSRIPNASAAGRPRSGSSPSPGSSSSTAPEAACRPSGSTPHTTAVAAIAYFDLHVRRPWVSSAARHG